MVSLGHNDLIYQYAFIRTTCKIKNHIKVYCEKYKLAAGALILSYQGITLVKYRLSTDRKSRWTIGGRWLQSSASQDGDGGKPAFKEGHFWQCYRAWIVAICEVLDIANLLHNNGQSSRANTAPGGTRIFRREEGDSIKRGRWLKHQVYLGGGWIWFNVPGVFV